MRKRAADATETMSRRDNDQLGTARRLTVKLAARTPAVTNSDHAA
jgi:hypothetical protein